MKKGFIIFGDAAVRNQNGTFTLVNGGASKIYKAPGKKALHDFGLVIGFEAVAVADEGIHTFQIIAVDSESKEIIPNISGTLETGKAGGWDFFPLAGKLKLEKPGPITFSLIVDGSELDKWVVNVIEEPLLGAK